MICRHYALVFVLLLTACGGSGSVKDTLGLSRKAPDEYRVVLRPPLSVPPQFELRPPAKPGEISPTEAASSQARALVTGKPVAADNTYRLPPSGSMPVDIKEKPSSREATPEGRFLERAGAAQADPSVRRALAEESIIREEAAQESSWWDIFSFGDKKKEPVVSPASEAERIKKNKADGKSPAEGIPAEVKPKNRGILDYILGD